jgi:hypothetical protein
MKRVLVCNYREGTSIAAPGARAYFSLGLPGLPDRAYLLVRSRSGRWVQKWENVKRLCNFRFTQMQPEHPMYADTRIADYLTDDTLQRLQWAFAEHGWGSMEVDLAAVRKAVA